jgi:hypothetical protein
MLDWIKQIGFLAKVFLSTKITRGSSVVAIGEDFDLDASCY